MKRLIDADALEQTLSNNITDDRGGYLTRQEIANNEAIVDTMQLIHEQPTVGAVPVSELQEVEKERDYWMNMAHSYEQTILRLTISAGEKPTIDAVPVIRCIDCHHFAISATFERADGTIRPVGYTCRLHREPVREDGFCSMAIKRPERWKHYE